ncbi:Transcriptional regulator of mannitol utilization [Collimonas arenae]|uniref:Transcriptional regulator of mannitol utilization n=1 Tax=Collimonas arenae TaxID=279058 RepID=A0A0A1FGN3_9BURK|nr:sugar-binding transcriptional regulator [Collimonas arenae]AIY42870.1 Transcriptional regulator of mannitol utilization [Collimonas arenae]
MASRNEKLDLAARAAWMYYVVGNTQNEIADHLGISRQMAQRLVAYARESGLVKVRVEHPVSECLALAAALQQKYGLEQCHVVPSVGSEDSLIDDAGVQQMLAVVGAEVVERYLQQENPLVVNVGSGRTLKAVLAAVPEMDRPQHRIVSMVGAIAADGSSNRYDVALTVADKTQGRFFLLPAPLVADSAEDMRQWCNHRVYRIVADLAQQADVTFIGVGTIALGCPMHEDGFLTAAEVLQLQAHGAVGEMIGHAITGDGRLIASPIEDRITSLPLTSPPTRPVIGMAGGVKKAEAIRAVLRGGWWSGLITDEYCARYALQEE